MAREAPIYGGGQGNEGGRAAIQAARTGATVGDDLTLFAPESEVMSAGDNSPVEHEGLPKPRKRDEQLPTLVLALETEEDREALAALLGGRVLRRAGGWECWWPPGSEQDEAELRFEFGGAE